MTTALTITIVIVAVLLFLLAFILVRTMIYASQAAASLSVDLPAPETPKLEIDIMEAAKHLSEVVQVKTISHEDPAEDNKELFTLMQKELEILYPRVHQTMHKELAGGFSLIYTWVGKNPELDPVLFTSHQDVVPADPDSLDQWTHPPFSGEIADGFIWGRGTLDIKSQLIAIFEAAEKLIANGYQPERTVILAFGHDEEVVGKGAEAIVANLQEKGIHLAALIDEGGTVLDNCLPGIKGLAATIGVAEKGFLSLKFKVEKEGGHSSTPDRESAIGILSRALVRLESNPFPADIASSRPMFQALAPASSVWMQVAFANLWLFKGLVINRLSKTVETDAALRTTTALTIIHSGVKDNILPGKAEAVVNFRILSGSTIAETCERVRRVINDEKVHFEPISHSAKEPSPVSPSNSASYMQIVAAIGDFFPGTIVAPEIGLGGTDARNYYPICEQVYRFTPVLTQKEDLNRVHGINERLSIDGLHTMIGFFYELIARWSAE